MSSLVEVIIRTIDESSGATGNIIGSFTELNSAIGLVKQGVQAMQGAYDATVGSVVSYDDSIRSVSAATGMSTEETSKLLDLTDNFNISTTALTMAQKNLAKDGYSLNIETLKGLNAEYKELGTQAEKTTFLIDKFGKSGMEFAVMFDYGSEAMEKFYNGSADGMVRTKEQIIQTMQLTMAQKDLGDAVQGIVNKTATPIIPMLTQGIEGATGELDLLQKSLEMIFKGDFAGQQQLVSDYWEKRENEINGVVDANHNLAGVQRRLYSVTAPTVEQTQALSQQYASQLSMTMQLAEQTDAFTEAQNELAQKIYATREELEKTKGVYYQGGQHVMQLKGQLSELQSQYDANTKANEENLNKQIYADYLKMNSGKELTYAQYQQEQAVAVALGISTDAERKKAEAIFQLNQKMSEGKLTAVEYADAIKEALAGTPGVSGQDAAQKWLEEHPTSAPAQQAPAPTPTPSPTTNATAGTGMGQAQQWLESQKQAKAVEDAAKKATSAMASEFSQYSSTVTKQADAAKKSVQELVDQLTGLGSFGTITITVTGNTTSGPEYP